MSVLDKLGKELRSFANPEKAKKLSRFFKTERGEYGEGDKFLGIIVPDIRNVVKKYSKQISLLDVKKLFKSTYHEERLTALLILVNKFNKATDKEKKLIYDLYLNNTLFINNWDLVDLTAPNIVGAYLYDKNKNILVKLAQSKSIWERRIAVLATFNFIRKGECQTSLGIAALLINDSHDLIHKAVGWMLREIGKRCGQRTEEEFLLKYYQVMPRIMLRYAIERFTVEKRNYYMRKSRIKAT